MWNWPNHPKFVTLVCITISYYYTTYTVGCVIFISAELIVVAEVPKEIGIDSG